MTESLLQQARRWRESASKPTREMNGFDWINFKCFLDDVIENLLEQQPDQHDVLTLLIDAIRTNKMGVAEEIASAVFRIQQARVESRQHG